MKKALSILLCCLVLITPTLAADTEETDAPSAWAADEVAEAIALGIVPLWGQSDYQQSVTRAEFAALAYNFCAMQYRSTLIEDYRTLHGEVPVSFTDVDHNTSHDTEIGYAAEMGIVLGCGDGTFAPEKTITRQEAATMLLRAYNIYGGESDDEAPTLAFPDADRVADWALDGAAQMSAWNVILGTGEGLFAPETTYTREQCYLTFLRLYKNAPVSRAQGNIQPLLTAEEYVEQILNQPYDHYYLKERLESDEVIVLSGFYASPHGGTSTYYVIYKGAQGGWESLFSLAEGLPHSWWSPYLSEFELEGTTLRAVYHYREMTDPEMNTVPVSIDLLTGEATITDTAAESVA